MVTGTNMGLFPVNTPTWDLSRARPAPGRRPKIVALVIFVFIFAFTIMHMSSPPPSAFDAPVSPGYLSEAKASKEQYRKDGHAVSDEEYDDKNHGWTTWHKKFGSSGAEREDTVTDSSSTGFPPTHDSSIFVKDQSASPFSGSPRQVAKCSILFNNPSIYERALRTHEHHNAQHGYPMYVLRDQMLDDVWTKPAYILHLILAELAKPPSQRLHWLFWVDADTILINGLVPIEVFLPPEGEAWADKINMLVSHDWNGLNNGVFPVRVNQWSAELFSAILSFRDYNPDAPLPFRDQSAMAEALKLPKFRSRVVKVPQRWFNAYQGEEDEKLEAHQVHRGDFLVHFAGVIDREPRMRKWLERTEKHGPDWEMEVEHTAYPSEIQTFWDEMRVERMKNKEAVAEELSEVDEMRALANDLLEAHKETLDERIRTKITQKLEVVKKWKEGKGSDEETKEGLDETRALKDQLREVTEQLFEMSNKGTKQLVPSAHVAVDKATGFLQQHEGRLDWKGLPRNLRDKVNELQEVLEEKAPSPSKLRKLLLELEDAYNKCKGEVDAKEEAARKKEEEEKAKQEEVTKQKENS